VSSPSRASEVTREHQKSRVGNAKKRDGPKRGPEGGVSRVRSNGNGAGSWRRDRVSAGGQEKRAKKKETRYLGKREAKRKSSASSPKKGAVRGIHLKNGRMWRYFRLKRGTDTAISPNVGKPLD